MLLLELSIAGQRYALPATHIVEVVPAVALTQTSGKLPTLDYRGHAVPVLDLGAHYRGVAGSPTLATRIVLVGRHSNAPLLGLLAERVTDTVKTKALRVEHSDEGPVPATRQQDERGQWYHVLDLQRIFAQVLASHGEQRGVK
jgi:chemotaxis-related protein WspB